MEQVETKFKVGKYLVPVTLFYRNGRIYLKFRYNKDLIPEIKVMQGAKWHGFEDPPVKMWSVLDCAHNHFRLDFLQMKNPYETYDKELVIPTSERPLYKHQLEMVAQGLTVHYCIWACEMGTGKSLAAIELAEQAGVEDIIYVGPKSGVKAVGRELIKWQTTIQPRMVTYEGLVKLLRNEQPAPEMVIFDESPKVKTPTSQRTQAAQHLADAVRAEHGDNGYIVLMTGTPAPKAPTDWWQQCEIACPGFLKEGNIHIFKKRLCLIEERESITGGVYPHIVTWLDDDQKCAVCGQLSDHEYHTDFSHSKHHFHKPSKNEVSFLYQRMQGLVLVKLKKDCLDLPEKQYRIIKIKPTPDTIRTAAVIKSTSSRAIEALTLLRELSDGFQYTEEKVGTDPCPNCQGSGKVTISMPLETVDPLAPQQISESDFKEQEVICDNCGGKGVVIKYARGIETVASPKDEAFIELLDEHDDVGRFIVWGGFTGTIDRLVEICHKYGWATLRVDGRGYIGQTALCETLDSDMLLDAMDFSHPRFKTLLEEIPKLCFVGHPQAGGMALTLTASPTELFYSNSFDGTARMQAEDRFHRAGMDTNRGATIIDLIHLSTDKLVLDNLKKKKKLQSLTMGDLTVRGERDE